MRRSKRIAPPLGTRIVARSSAAICGCLWLTDYMLERSAVRSIGIAPVSASVEYNLQYLTASTQVHYLQPKITLDYENPIAERQSVQIDATVTFTSTIVELADPDAFPETPQTVYSAPSDTGVIQSLSELPWDISMSISSTGFGQDSAPKTFPRGTALPIETSWVQHAEARGDYRIVLRIENLNGEGPPIDVTAEEIAALMETLQSERPASSAADGAPEARSSEGRFHEISRQDSIVRVNGEAARLDSANELVLPFRVVPFGLFTNAIWDVVLAIGAILGVIIGSGLLAATLGRIRRTQGISYGPKLPA